jgi:hypothetical protein
MTAFLITGLPRSRTAWMAVAATDGTAVCYHEPTMHLARWDDVFDEIWHGHGGFEHVGISDHGLGFHLPEITRRQVRTLIIDRPIAEVDASLARIGLGGSNFCDLLAEALAYRHSLIRRVPYAALADTDTVIACLDYLMPGAFIDPARIADLQGENIQADVHAAIRAGMARADDLTAFLPGEALARLRSKR